jgi:hypothetical protein
MHVDVDQGLRVGARRISNLSETQERVLAPQIDRREVRLSPARNPALTALGGGFFVGRRGRFCRRAGGLCKLDTRGHPCSDASYVQHGADEYRSFQSCQSPHVDNSSFSPELLQFMKG